eukprot:13130121-Alexandrium_andersonii.AAC.1
MRTGGMPTAQPSWIGRQRWAPRRSSCRKRRLGRGPHQASRVGSVSAAWPPPSSPLGGRRT